MPFFNGEGGRVSFDRSALIDELRADIAEFGGDRLVDVIAEVCAGVTIYKDYFCTTRKRLCPACIRASFGAG